MRARPNPSLPSLPSFPRRSFALEPANCLPPDEGMNDWTNQRPLRSCTNSGTPQDTVMCSLPAAPPAPASRGMTRVTPTRAPLQFGWDLDLDALRCAARQGIASYNNECGEKGGRAQVPVRVHGWGVTSGSAGEKCSQGR